MSRIYIGFLILLFAHPGAATVLFSDDFDDHPDWSTPAQDFSSGASDSAQDGDATTACTGCPGGTAKYSGWRSDRSAWAAYRGNNTLVIDATNKRGGTGKGLTFWMEPINSSSCDGGTYWCSDGQLAVTLNGNYDEVYIRFWIKFQADFVWDSTNGNAAGKFARVSHYHEPPGSMWTFGTGANGSHHPVFFLDFVYPSYGGGGDKAINRFSPRYQATYEPQTATPVGIYSEDVAVAGGTGTGGDQLWTEYLQDGSWHEIILMVKANTAGGYYAGTANGEYRMWVDGTSIRHKTDMAWADDTDANNYWTPAAFAGWNWVSFGGNFYNRYYSAATEIEQWYAIDDVVIATTYAEAETGAAASSSTTIGSGTPVTIGSGTTVTIQ